MNFHITLIHPKPAPIILALYGRTMADEVIISGAVGVQLAGKAYRVARVGLDSKPAHGRAWIRPYIRVHQEGKAKRDCVTVGALGFFVQGLIFNPVKNELRWPAVSAALTFGRAREREVRAVFPLRWVKRRRTP